MDVPYRRFMEGFYKIALPITRLIRKSTKFELTKEYERSFQELKKKLVIAPVLPMSKGNECFMIYSDASNKSLEYVVMQNGKLSTYASKLLKPYEKNYLTHNLELIAMVFALNI